MKRLMSLIPRSTLAVLIGSLLAGVTIAAAVLLMSGREEQIAARLVAALQGATPRQAERVFAQARRLGPAGIEVLVAGLASPDPLVVNEARRQMWAVLDQWEGLSSSEAAARLDRLAESLARGMDAMSPEARDVAAAIATRILLWPLDASDASRAPRVAACERILRGGRRDVPRVESALAQDSRPREAAQSDDPSKRFAEHLAPSATATLPGGGLPVTNPLREPKQAAVNPRATRPAQTAQTKRIPATPVSTNWNAAEAAALPVEAEKKQEPATPADAKLTSLRELLRNDPRQLSSFDLCRLTHDAEAAIVAAARTELGRRQIDARLIELGRMLTDPDVETRLAWTEQLTRIAGIDAEPWLIALLDDEAPAVRRAAVAILATVPGKQHAARIAQMAAADPAPEVRELAARSLQTR